MSSDQGKGEKVPISPAPSQAPNFGDEPIPLEADIPGFEFELEENLSQISSADSVHSIRMPNFDDNRHPNVKLFVVVFAIAGCMYLIYKSCRDIPKEFRSILCNWFLFDTCSRDFDENTRVMEYIEFIFRVSLELIYPFAMILVFLITHLLISWIPQLAFRIRNPVPLLAKLINLVLCFNCITNFLCSISMLPFLSITTHWSFWQEYLTVSGMGMFWMYQFLNMNAFSKLTVFNFIRARENYEMRQNALGDMNL